MATNSKERYSSGGNGRKRASAGMWAQLFSLLRAQAMLIVILLLGMALRFYALGAESLWIDEGTSFTVANMSVPEILANRIYDNPPFYFILLHFWVQLFGNSEIALRLLSAVFGWLALFSMFQVGSKLLGRRGGLLAAFLLAIALFHVEFSQEARAFSLMVLLVVLSMQLFIKLFEERSLWVAAGYVLINVMLLYTHFYGAFFVVVQNLFWLFLFLWRRRALTISLPQWVGVQGAILLLFAPWLRYLWLELQSMQAREMWIPMPTAVTLWQIFLEYASDSTLLLFLFVGLVIFGLLYGRSPTSQGKGGSVWQDDTAVYVLLLLWLFVPIIVPYIASYLIAPLLIPRYTIAASLSLYLLVAAALLHIRWPLLHYGLLVLIVLTSLLGLSRYYSYVDKQQWREMVAYLDQQGEPGDLLLFNPGGIRGNAFAYYFQREDMVQKQLDLSFDIVTSYSGPNKPQNLSDVAHLVAGADRVWLIQANSNDSEGLVPQTLTALYDTAEQFPFHGIGLSLYRNVPESDVALVDGATVTQVIRYHLPEAAAVNLVWGVNDWQPLPASSQTMATAVRDNLMVTAMQPDGETFFAELQLPEAVPIDYVFQVTESQQQTPVNLWDNRNGQDYQLLAGFGEPVTHESAFTAEERRRLANHFLTTQEIRYKLPGATAVNLVWGVDGWQGVPPAYWPPDTKMVGSLLYTPMVPAENEFVVPVEVAQGSQLNYVFQVFVDDGSGLVEVWDTNQKADYILTAADSRLVEIRPSISLWPYRLLAWQTGREWLVWLSFGLLILTGSYLARRQAYRWQRPRFFNSRQWLYLRDLMIELVSRDIKLRYKGSFLGILWSLLNPFMQLLVFSFVFQALLPLDIPNYAAYLFTGLLAWGWFNASLTASATVILEGRDLIRRPGFPPIVLPVVTVGSNLIHFLLSLPILLLFLLFTNIVLTPNVFWLPVIIVLQFLFTLSLAYFVATLHVMFRDTQHLLNVFLLLLFYLTPIFYDASLFSERIQWLFQLNPLLMLLDAYRAIFINGQPPNFMVLLVLLAGSLGLLAVGYQLFLRTSYRFVEEL